MADELAAIMSDPNLIARLLLEERQARANAQREVPMPTLPPMPDQRREMRNPALPQSATAPVERSLADMLMSAPAGAFEGGQMMGEGVVHRDAAKAAAGAGLTLAQLGAGIGSRRGQPPKWARESGRFPDSDVSHAGMAPVLAASAGAGAGGYLGSELDPNGGFDGMTLGALLGTVMGGGGGLVALNRHLDSADAARKAADGAYKAQRAAAEAQPTLASTLTRPKLTERMDAGKKAVPSPQQAELMPADLAGPTGSKSAPKNASGQSVREEAGGGWRDTKTGRFADPPDTHAMTEGFSDADLAAVRKK